MIIRREARHFKALYFDLRIKDLKKHYSESHPKGAYAKLQHFLINHNFSHVQYSGYHSLYKTTDLEIFDLVRDMSESFPWLQHCVSKFEVTNVGSNYDISGLFADDKIDIS